MLGELIGTETGTVTAFRVVKDGFGVKVESQFQGHGEMLGIPFVDYATYLSVYRPDGNFTGGRRRHLHERGRSRVLRGHRCRSHAREGGRSQLGRRALFLQRITAFRPAQQRAVLFEFEIAENARDMEIKYYEWKSAS